MNLSHDLATYRAWGERAKPAPFFTTKPVPWSMPMPPTFGWRLIGWTESAYVLLGCPDWPGNDQALTPKARWKLAVRQERLAMKEATKEMLKGEIGSLYGVRMYKSSEV